MFIGPEKVYFSNWTVIFPPSKSNQLQKNYLQSLSNDFKIAPSILTEYTFTRGKMIHVSVSNKLIKVASEKSEKSEDSENTLRMDVEERLKLLVRIIAPPFCF